MNFPFPNKDYWYINEGSSMGMEYEEGGDISQLDPNEERGYHLYDSDAEYRNDGYISNNSDIRYESEAGYSDGGNLQGGSRGGGNS